MRRGRRGRRRTWDRGTVQAPCRAPYPAERRCGLIAGWKSRREKWTRLSPSQPWSGRADHGLSCWIIGWNGGSRGRESRSLGRRRGCEVTGSERARLGRSGSSSFPRRDGRVSAKPGRAHSRLWDQSRRLIERMAVSDRGIDPSASSGRMATISSETRARPKSVILSVPSSVTSRLPGLISR